MGLSDQQLRMDSTVLLSSLADLEDAAAYCKLAPESLKNWVVSGHAPHYFVDGKGPLFRKKELSDWVKENLVQVRGGMPVPRRLDILCTAGPNGPGAPPLALATVQSLCLLSLGGMVSGVYFLCDGDEVVYVGQFHLPHPGSHPNNTGEATALRPPCKNFCPHPRLQKCNPPHGLQP